MEANLHNPTTLNTSSPPFPQEPDDISLFLQQIILRSSSSSSSALMRHQPFAALSDQLFAEDAGSGMGSDQITAPEPYPLLHSLNSGCGLTAGNVSSFSTAKLDNEVDDYDYESEEVVEAVMEETAPKPTPSRSSSKRSRAAEVHNQSEKRRRSRINEKMKALQNLIPNSNKVVKATDKASMLDEAIEYLKQLQLQVQMLTMRNGLSLYPMCVPGMFQTNQHTTSQMRTETYDTDNFTNVYTTESVSVDPNISADALVVGSKDKCAKRGPVIDYSTTVGGSKSSLKVEPESSMLDHLGSFRQSRLYQGICEEKVQPCQPLSDDHPRTAGVKITSSIPCQTTNTSDLKEMSLDAFCLAGGDHLLQNFINHPIFSSTHLDM